MCQPCNFSKGILYNRHLCCSYTATLPILATLRSGEETRSRHLPQAFCMPNKACFKHTYTYYRRIHILILLYYTYTSYDKSRYTKYAYRQQSRKGHVRNPVVFDTS